MSGTGTGAVLSSEHSAEISGTMFMAPTARAASSVSVTPRSDGCFVRWRSHDRWLLL